MLQTLFVLSWTITLAMAITPKMLQTEPTNEPLLGSSLEGGWEILSARTATFLGDCVPTFQFALSGGSGHGVIGVPTRDTALACTIGMSSGSFNSNQSALVLDFMGIGTTTTGLVGLPFAFENVAPDGGIATLTCAMNTPVTIRSSPLMPVSLRKPMGVNGGTCYPPKTARRRSKEVPPKRTRVRSAFPMEIVVPSKSSIPWDEKRV
jgi:hypothetical protein